MSTVFEAFVVLGDCEEITSFFEEKELLEFPARQMEVEEEVSAIFIDSPTTLDPEAIEKIANAISQEFNDCLYVYWNDEDNTSYAMLYDESGFVDMFGEEDEIWVEVNEKGRPNLKGQHYTKQQTLESQDTEKSYICIVSSLDAGLLMLNPHIPIRGQALITVSTEDFDDEDLEDDSHDDEGFY